MNSYALTQFWRCYDRLPGQIQRRTQEAYRRWRKNPFALGLAFKRVGKTRPVYSVRIDDDYRTLGILQGDTVTWFWIGSHDEYVRLLKHA